MNKTYFKKTENILYNYKMLKLRAEKIEALLNSDLYGSGVTSINSEMQPSKTNKFYSVTELTAIRELEKKEDLKKELEYIKHTLYIIDKSIALLSEEEQQIIELRYKKEKSWISVVMETNFSERWVYQMRNRAIKKIAIVLYGERTIA